MAPSSFPWRIRQGMCVHGHHETDEDVKNIPFAYQAMSEHILLMQQLDAQVSACVAISFNSFCLFPKGPFFRCSSPSAAYGMCAMPMPGGGGGDQGASLVCQLNSD